MENKNKIACCNICLIADSMKVCQSCPFNPGMLKLSAEELKQVQRIELLKDGKK